MDASERHPRRAEYQSATEFAVIVVELERCEATELPLEKLFSAAAAWVTAQDSVTPDQCREYAAFTAGWGAHRAPDAQIDRRFVWLRQALQDFDSEKPSGKGLSRIAHGGLEWLRLRRDNEEYSMVLLRELDAFMKGWIEHWRFINQIESKYF